jgi:hypothetical protein
MPSELERHVFICTCDDIEHQFIAQVYDWGDDVDLINSVHLTSGLGFLRRIWVAIKYVFDITPQGAHFETITMNPEDVDRLSEVLFNYKKKYLLYQEKKEANVAPNFDRIKLDIPARYGVKFICADYDYPLAIIHYSINGVPQNEVIRYDASKNGFLEKPKNEFVLRALNEFKEDILKALPKKET